MSKSHKKQYRRDDVEERSHHISKKYKTNASNKQMRKLERVIDDASKSRDLKSLYNDLENFA